MKTHQIVDELKTAARRLGLEVRTERGNFRGGRCTVDGEEMIILNRRHLAETQLVVLAESMRDLPLDKVFLRPAVRTALEDAWLRAEDINFDAADEEA